MRSEHRGCSRAHRPASAWSASSSSTFRHTACRGCGDLTPDCSPSLRGVTAFIGAVWLVAVLVAVLAPVAGAHGPAGGGVGYVSTVGGLEPPVLGVIVSVLGGDDRLQLVNYSGKTVVVHGLRRRAVPALHGGRRLREHPLADHVPHRERDQARRRRPGVGQTPAQRRAGARSTRGLDLRLARPPHPLDRRASLPAVDQGGAERDRTSSSAGASPRRADGKRVRDHGLPRLPRRRRAAGDGGTSPWLIAAVVGAAVARARARSEPGPAAPGGRPRPP